MKQATTPLELNHQFTAIAACAAITAPALVADLDAKVAGLRRVGTHFAIVLAKVIEKAEAQALEQPTPVGQRIALAELVTWTGAIKIGWV